MFSSNYTVHEWAVRIRIFAGIIFVAGIIELILGFVAYYGVSWVDVVIGFLLVCCGTRGIHAARVGTAYHARQYLGSLIGTTIAVIIIDIIGLAIASVLAEDLCAAYNLSPGECSTLHTDVIARFVVLMIIFIFVCSGCIFSARRYLHAINNEGHHHHHTTVVTAYQQVPTQPQYAAPVYPPQSYPAQQPQQPYPNQYQQPQYPQQPYPPPQQPGYPPQYNQPRGV